MRWNIRSGRLYYWSLTLILLAGSGIAACTVLSKPQPIEKRPVSREVELNAWQEGMLAFNAGDYEKARAIFEALTESAETDSLRRRAFFALASTRLALAQTPEEFGEAMSVWTCWGRQKAAYPEEEDPWMLTPFLERLTPPGAAEVQPSQSQPLVKKIVVYSPSGSCKDQLQAKEKELDRTKTKLDAREKEIRRLKHQIDSLEAIHLKYQERKQGVSSP